MCVIVARKIQLYYWKKRSFHELREDLSVPDVPRCVAWCNETLCFGFKNEYCTMDVSALLNKIPKWFQFENAFFYCLFIVFITCLKLLSGTSKTVCATGKYGEPIIARVFSNAFAVVQEKQSFIIHLESDNKMVKKMGLEDKEDSDSEEMNLAVTWSEIPLGLRKLLGIHLLKLLALIV